MRVWRLTLLVVLALMVVGVAWAGEPTPDEKCPATCCEAPPKVICLPAVESKTRTHTLYRCEKRTICLPYKPAGDCGCTTGECGRPREVRVLIKRFVKEVGSEVKCKPLEAPCEKATAR